MKDQGKAKRGIPVKSEFNSWYPAIVEIADLVDKRYPIKGMDVWKPYGWKTMSLIDSIHVVKWKELTMKNTDFLC